MKIRRSNLYGEAEWWIAELPDDEPDVGPYDTNAEAISDMKGLARYFKYGHLKSFWTTERPQEKRS